MKSSRSIAYVLFIIQAYAANGQQLQWFTSYGSVLANSEGRNLMVLPRGNGELFGIGMAGGTTWDLDGNQVSVSGDSDVLLFELDEQGEALWAATDGGNCEDPDPWDDTPRAALSDTLTGTLVVAGDYSGNATFAGSGLSGWCAYRNMFISAYGANGSGLWASRATGPNIVANDLLSGPDDNIHVFGKAIDGPATFHATSDVVIEPGGFHATYGNDGSLVQAEQILTTGEVQDAVRYGTDFVLCGKFTGEDTLWLSPLAPAAPLTSGFLCRTSGTSSIAWSVVCGSSSWAEFIDCVGLSNGDIAVAGYFMEDVFIGEDTLLASGASSYDRFIGRFSPSGSLLWLRRVSSPQFFVIRSLVADSDGGFYMHGTVSTSLAIGNATVACTTSRDQFVARVDENGMWVGSLFLGRSGFSTLTGLHVVGDDIFVSGSFDSTMVIGSESFEPMHMNWPDLFVAKFNGLAPVNSVQSIGLLDDELHIYANPSSGVCTMDLPASIVTGDPYTLTIFDALGAVVQRVPLTIQEDRIRLDISAEAKGMYHVELVDGKRRYSGTIVFQ